MGMQWPNHLMWGSLRLASIYTEEKTAHVLALIFYVPTLYLQADGLKIWMDSQLDKLNYQLHHCRRIRNILHTGHEVIAFMSVWDNCLWQCSASFKISATLL